MQKNKAILKTLSFSVFIITTLLFVLFSCADEPKVKGGEPIVVGFIPESLKEKTDSTFLIYGKNLNGSGGDVIKISFNNVPASIESVTNDTIRAMVNLTHAKIGLMGNPIKIPFDVSIGTESLYSNFVYLEIINKEPILSGFAPTNFFQKPQGSAVDFIGENLNNGIVYIYIDDIMCSITSVSNNKITVSLPSFDRSKTSIKVKVVFEDELLFTSLASNADNTIFNDPGLRRQN